MRKVRLGDGFRLEGVCFRYGPELPDVLAEINLSIRPGERIAIVGKSGSGKSTLVNLLPRFFDPTDGRILLDGTDLRRLDLDRLRALFGIVTQDVILFHDTVEANIGYAAPGASFEQIQEAARAAHAEEFIHSLPEGYGTVVGEQGALFSGGQRQRISIARALLRRPEVVILDEATSALDPEAEEAVSGALDQLTRGRTVLVVTHRLASARSADRIVLLKEGRIEHIGTHEELLAHSDLYRDLARRQRLVSAEEAARLAGDAAP